MLLPDVDEILVILFISTWTFALGNLGTLGDWVWKLRCRLNPSLAEDAEDA